MAYPPPPSNIGKQGRAKTPDQKTHPHKIKDEIRIHQTRSRNKLIYLQLIELENGREELRLGYYMIGKKGAMRGRWVWGQYALLIPRRDLKAMIRQAEKRGWV